MTEVAARAGVALRPLHPGVDDPALATFYVADAPDADAAEALRRDLVDLPGVQAAYVKPPDAPP
ncbi:MAG: hypothetical protein H0V26_14590 [Solirubrobacterales bacterium]|nr:hypothetical protein [Solirubrobacterales bacterium]